MERGPWAAVLSLTKRLAITIHSSLVYTITTEAKGLGLMVLRLFSEVTSDELLLTSGQLHSTTKIVHLLVVISSNAEDRTGIPNIYMSIHVDHKKKHASGKKFQSLPVSIPRKLPHENRTTSGYQGHD